LPSRGKEKSSREITEERTRKVEKRNKREEKIKERK
jgi:hypothetical protein